MYVCMYVCMYLYRVRVESELRTIGSGANKMDIRTIRRSLARLMQAIKSTFLLCQY